MPQVNKTPYFLKKAKKVINRNFEIAKQVDSCIKKLAENPNSPSLKSHKVDTPKFGKAYSSRVTSHLNNYLGLFQRWFSGFRLAGYWWT